MRASSAVIAQLLAKPIASSGDIDLEFIAGQLSLLANFIRAKQTDSSDPQVTQPLGNNYDPWVRSIGEAQV